MLTCNHHSNCELHREFIMPKVLRSPPKGDSQITLPDSDTGSTETTEPFCGAQRHKKRRGSPVQQLSADELKRLLLEWKESQTKTLDKLASDISEIKNQNLRISETNTEIEKSLEFLHSNFSSLQEKVQILENERKDNLLRITTLESKIEDMERSMISGTVEIRSVPLKDNKIDKAQLTDIVLNTCKAINVDIQKNDINDVFVLKSKAECKTIITEFKSKNTKHEIINKAKTYNKNNPNNKLNTTTIGLDNHSKPIYVSEALTPKGRRLFFLARDTAKIAHFKYCWTKNGRIYMRKTDETQYIEVKDEVQLNNLKTSK